MEKVLFVSVDIGALGILVEPDARGNAAVVKSMLTPLNVELSRKSLDERSPAARSAARLSSLSDASVLNVGDVLFAINGKLVHETPHAEVLSILHIDAFSTEDISMVVLSFTDPYLYYRELKAGTLESHAMDDEALFGKIRRAGGWREYLPTLPTWSYFTGGGATAGPRQLPPRKESAAQQPAPGRPPPAASSAPQRPPSISTTAAATASAAVRSVASAAAAGGAPLTTRKSSGSQDTHCGAAYLKFSAGEFEQALQVYSSVLERDPLSHTVRVSRSLCYLRLHEPRAALKDAEMCCALKPEWPMSYVCKGAALDAMGKPLEACIAYVCGLIVDPSNAVLQRRVDDLFAKLHWTCIELDGEQVVGPVAAAVLQRDEWGPDLLLDRILLFKDREQCAKDFLDAPGVSLRQEQRDGIDVVQVRLDTSCKAEKLDSCEIYDHDELVTVNATPVHAPDDVRRLVESANSERVVRVGIFSGARLAAANLLSGKAGELTVKALSVKRATVFNVYIDSCGTAAANGVYVPQETKNGTYVFENGNGCLLSLETVRRPNSSDKVYAWILSRGRAILYTCALPGERGAESFHLGDDNRFVIEMQKLHWRRAVGAAPLPRVHRTSTVPSLSYLTGDSDSDGVTPRSPAGDAQPGNPSLEDEWNFDVQILAIKGYGNRALNRKDFDTAITCYELVEDQIEAFTADAQDSSVAGDAFLDALRETVGHRTSFSSRSVQAEADAEDGSRGEQTHGTAAAAAAAATAAAASSNSSDVGKLTQASSGTLATAPATPSSLQRILDDAQQSYRHELQLEAEAVYRDVLLKVLISKAQLCLETGRAQKALAYAERVCTAPSSGAAKPMGLYVQAVALASLGRVDEAVDICTVALEVLSSDQVIAQRFEGLLAELHVQQQQQREESSEGKAALDPGATKIKKLGSAFSSEAIFPSPASMAAARRRREDAGVAARLGSGGATGSSTRVASSDLAAQQVPIREKFVESPGASAVATEATRIMGRRIPVAQVKATTSKKDKIRSRYVVMTNMSITIASKMRQTLHISKGRLVLYRDDLEGVVLGAARDLAHVSTADARCFTLILKDSEIPVVLRAATSADAASLARVIAAWKAGDVSS